MNLTNAYLLLISANSRNDSFFNTEVRLNRIYYDYLCSISGNFCENGFDHLLG